MQRIIRWFWRLHQADEAEIFPNMIRMAVIPFIPCIGLFRYCDGWTIVTPQRPRSFRAGFGGRGWLCQDSCYGLNPSVSTDLAVLVSLHANSSSHHFTYSCHFPYYGNHLNLLDLPSSYTVANHSVRPSSFLLTWSRGPYDISAPPPHSMPSHAPDRSSARNHLEADQANVACPAPLTPPSETDEDQALDLRTIRQRAASSHGITRTVERDNTAAGMSLMQEDSIYAFAEAYEEKMPPQAQHGSAAAISEDHDIKMDDESSINGHTGGPGIDLSRSVNVTPVSTDDADATSRAAAAASDATTASPRPNPSLEEQGQRLAHDKAGVSSIDQKLDWSDTSKAWEFSRKRLRPQYPSSTFQPYSKFKGTQQSDRQIYNVEVTILTVDIEQSTMSGYLQICGLTPDHPTLTTFFTGEIIGGPEQKYSFRTRDPAWGASDKTDLTHWARFPAWRPLSLQAKRNINFVYPLNDENWWQQDYIFMRWKEHFLVPDYKLKSIQGASFEGFYYICFNQVEGRVSGIYFHSKSEK